MRALHVTLLNAPNAALSTCAVFAAVDIFQMVTQPNVSFVIYLTAFLAYLMEFATSVHQVT
jgi:membrane-bound ClpP family serine protease